MGNSGRYGISVDIGTTNITIHLTGLEDGVLKNELVLRNPQRQYGEEVISRLDFARTPETASSMMELVRGTINDGITSILFDSKCERNSVDSVVVVGNSVMHHLFFGLSTSSLLKPPYTAENKDSILIRANEVGLDFYDHTICYSPPLIESFVGADAIAMMIASGFIESKSKLVSIDVGTNTEIAALNRGEVWIASAASGPAFEGMSIECGTPGEVGAINQVLVDPMTFQPRIKVMGKSKPKGICGTGVISALASMLDTGLLLSRGSFNRDLQTPWLVTDRSIVYYIIATNRESATNSDIILSQPDVRMIQQSKASIRSALDIVLKHALLDPSDIDTLFLTGVFGSGLSVSDAVRIGLFPEITKTEVKQIRGAASVGADLMHQRMYKEHAEKLAKSTNHIELTDNPDFKKRFTENLPFP